MSPFSFDVRDRVHGKVHLSPVSVSIMDTPEFQRLRRVKPLQLAEYVCPTGLHTYFAQAIGTAYLSRRWVEHLRRSQADLLITDSDVMAVEVAALCLNLGCRPFSRCWDDAFRQRGISPPLSQEEMSAAVFHRVFKSKKVQEAFKRFDDVDRNRIFVEELITGRPYNPSLGGPALPNCSANEGGFLGRPDTKCFLYELVRSKTHVDMSTCDAVIRAAETIGLDGGSVPVLRIIQESRASEVSEGKFGICFRDKVFPDLQELFHLKDRLELAQYERGPLLSIEKMFTAALISAGSSSFRVKTASGRVMTLFDAAQCPEGVLKLTDASLFEGILDSCGADLAEARHLTERIRKRDLYPLAFVRSRVPEVEVDVEGLGADLSRNLVRLGCGQSSPSSSVVVDRFSVRYGNDDEESLKNVRFFAKNAPDRFVHGLKSNFPRTKLFAPQRTRVAACFVLCPDESCESHVVRALRDLGASASWNWLAVSWKFGRGDEDDASDDKLCRYPLPETDAAEPLVSSTANRLAA